MVIKWVIFVSPGVSIYMCGNYQISRQKFFNQKQSKYHCVSEGIGNHIIRIVAFNKAGPKTIKSYTSFVSKISQVISLRSSDSNHRDRHSH